ncbi:amino acid ABC transporter permease [Cellulomonas endometrii]|uniref:amino acid ABC transporter permease n=1 Tax=Cellulomonas endometrii TaxID=3036301 RepID=UPI0024ACC1BB|nr:amino acid ABC transporter permease [Cellulomonas endometrii]
MSSSSGRNAASFLYDAPGPRTRRRTRIASVVSVLVIAGLITAGLVQFASHGQLDAEKWTPFTQWPIWQYLLVGLGGTLQAAAVVAVLGGAIGVLLALGRLSHVKPLRWVATALVEIGRTIPVLLLIYLMLFGLPRYGINLPVLWKLVVPLTVANSAVIAEIVRAGIQSLPKGQTEAALSLGMRRHQVMRLVVLPQAVRYVTPSLVTQLVSLIKDTSLGYVVAFTELLYRAQVLSAYNRLLVQTFLAVTLIYLVCNGSLSALASRLQDRMRRRTPAPAATPGAAPTPDLETLRA